jgi:hypothetical protein
MLGDLVHRYPFSHVIAWCLLVGIYAPNTVLTISYCPRIRKLSCFLLIHLRLCQTRAYA